MEEVVGLKRVGREGLIKRYLVKAEGNERKVCEYLKE